MVLATAAPPPAGIPPPPVGAGRADAAGVTVQTLRRPGHAPHRHQLRGGHPSAASSSTSTRSSARRPGSSPPPGRPGEGAPKRASAPPSCATACLRACASCWSMNARTSTASTTADLRRCRPHHSRPRKPRLMMVVGDDDQNIYAFGGASVRHPPVRIRLHRPPLCAGRELPLDPAHHPTANRIIGRALPHMKAGQEIRINHARRDRPTAASMKPSTRSPGGGCRCFRCPRSASGGCLGELQRPCAARAGRRQAGAGSGGRFAVIARRWAEPRSHGRALPPARHSVQMQRDGEASSAHVTAKAMRCCPAARRHRRTGRRRVLRSRLLSLVPAPLPRPPEGDRAPCRAALAQFIVDAESAAPGCELVVDDLIETLYDVSAIGKPSADARPNAPARADDRAPRQGAGVRPCADPRRRRLAGQWRRRAALFVAMTGRARRSRCARSSAGGILRQ